MSEVLRTENNEIIRRDDDGKEEFFTEEEYKQTEYQDAPEKKAIEEKKDKFEKNGAMVSKIAMRKKKEAEEGNWWQKGQYE